VSTRTPLIAGNWKMHKTEDQAEEYIQGLLPRLSGVDGVEVAICVPFTDLKAMVDENEFRADLYYRLHVFPLSVPPLRERREDIPLLTRYFVQKHAQKMGRAIDKIPTSAMEALTRYDWPGNIRELQNVIERSVIVCDTDEFSVDESWLSAKPVIDRRLKLSTSIAEHEKAVVEEALRATGGRVFGPSGAAARLGIPRSTLESKIRALKINKNRFRARS